MNDYAVIDVETSLLKDGEIPETKFWGYADSTRYERFNTTQAMQKFLRKLPPKVLLHHSNFDVIQLLIDGAKDFAILKSHDGRLIRCRWMHHYLTNSYSVFPVSMAAIFQAFGFEKTSLRNLEKRNYEDCVNGLKCFLELDALFESITGGISPLHKGTIASTGFAAAELFAGKLPKDLRFLQAYRGGRVEVFDTRKTVASKLDISSSYPRSFVECPERSELLRVKVNTKDWHGPLFDAGNSEMLVFPNGEFSSYVYRDVFEKYIEPNAERTKIKILSKHKIDLSWLARLKPVVMEIYDKKNESSGGVRLCCKLLLNSLYGRIGLKGESERARILSFMPDGDDIAVYRLRKGQYLVFDKILREPRSNFSFAAFITDNARARLFEAFKRNRAIYGDTDSIFTSVTRKQFSGEIGERIGDWTFEGRGWFKAINVKDYEHACYSCKGKVCKKCRGSGIVSIRKGGNDFIAWTLKKFAAGKTAESVHRTRQSGLRKRLVLPDGTTQPLIISR